MNLRYKSEKVMAVLKKFRSRWWTQKITSERSTERKGCYSVWGTRTTSVRSQAHNSMTVALAHDGYDGEAYSRETLISSTSESVPTGEHGRIMVGSGIGLV